MIVFQDKPAPKGYTYDLAIVRGTLSEADIQKLVNAGSPKTLVLNVFNGWDGNLLSVLSALNGIEVVSIDIFCASDSNLPVNAFDCLSRKTKSSIQYLRLAGQLVGDLSLDHFPNLADFGMGFTAKGKNGIKIDWGSCSNLASLGGAWPHFPSIDLLSKMPKLSSIASVRPGFSPESLGCINGLNRIEFAYWNKLKSFTQFGELREKLLHLELYSASKIESYEGLNDFINLKYLDLGKCPPVKYGSIFSSMINLEVLQLAETKILDGDLACLYSLPNLKKLSLVDQKNLSPTRDALYHHFGLL